MKIPASRRSKRHRDNMINITIFGKVHYQALFIPTIIVGTINVPNLFLTKMRVLDFKKTIMRASESR